jgi:hypothetical protein
VIRALAVGALALLFTAAAFSASHGSVPLPPLSAFLIAPTDFEPGVKVIDTTLAVAPGQNGFLRILGRAKLSGKPLSAIALAIVYHDADQASGDFGTMRTEVGLREGRAKFGETWGESLVRGAANGPGREKLTIKKASVGVRVSLGQSAFRLPVTFKTNRGLMRMSLGVVQIDRVLDIIALVPSGGELSVGDVNGLIAASLHHLQTAFTVSNAAPPTIGGTAQQGHTLTLDEGAWFGAPSTFSYEWSRCDATGSACTPIPGATAKTYAPGSADSGTTLRVAVTGSNSVSTGQATSPPTVAVV